MYRFFAAVCMCALSAFSFAEDAPTTLPLIDKGMETYYVKGSISGYGELEFMVDTGSGLTTINEEMLSYLVSAGTATYSRDLRGILANGSVMQVPVYNIKRLKIGKSCWVNDVEAAVFAGKTRSILGMSVLKKMAPFTFNVEPPSLELSNCDDLTPNIASTYP